jgi:hypothetical protein
VAAYDTGSLRDPSAWTGAQRSSSTCTSARDTLPDRPPHASAAPGYVGAGISRRTGLTRSAAPQPPRRAAWPADTQWARSSGDCRWTSPARPCPVCQQDAVPRRGHRMTSGARSGCAARRRRPPPRRRWRLRRATDGADANITACATLVVPSEPILTKPAPASPSRGRQRLSAGLIHRRPVQPSAGAPTTCGCCPVGRTPRQGTQARSLASMMSARPPRLPARRRASPR